MHPSDEYENPPGRLIDELISYLQTRQRTPPGQARSPVDDDRLIRSAVRQLRRHPIPTALLGLSAIWLLLAEDGEDAENEPQLGRQIEDEIVGQIKGGYDYTGTRLRELSDRYPWAAAAALVAGGLGAAFLLPERRRRAATSYDQPEPMTENPIPEEDFDFESPEEEEPPFR